MIKTLVLLITLSTTQIFAQGVHDPKPDVKTDIRGTNTSTGPNADRDAGVGSFNDTNGINGALTTPPIRMPRSRSRTKVYNNPATDINGGLPIDAALTAQDRKYRKQTGQASGTEISRPGLETKPH